MGRTIVSPPRTGNVAPVGGPARTTPGVIYLTKRPQNQVDSQGQAGIEVTPAMIEAGVRALRLLCPVDLAFPVGGEDEAVRVVLEAGIAARAGSLVQV